MDVAPKTFLRTPARRRGWGRVIALALGLVVLSARFAYGGEPIQLESVVVAPGDSLWSIAQAHYAGDPRPHVDAIIRLNHLASPVVVPGETLQIPRV
ncbi:MAG TPA: LysM peptidoglycan-binding domain-containing protein [Candidatus Limnocylindrales bacterium]|nr:LysM peptidoglycan-binding domain-containing protein [Candidatus Limnocylindrales bacterium]